MTTVDDDWRGVANEEDVPDEPKTGLRLQARARRLLGTLIRPHRRAVAVAVVLLVGQSLAELAGPLLVASAIDTGIPAAVAGDAAPLVWAIVGYAGSAAAAAGLRAGFLLLTGRVGQDVLLDVRRRVFEHGQRLSLDFHERFTSGRFISRLTSDVDALNDLLEKGLDGFGGAVLSLVGISVLLVWLDPVLAVIVLAGFVPLLLATRWFQHRSRATYRRTRVTVARLIVQFVESMNGIRAVQAYRREQRNDEIMDDLGAAYRDANADTIRAVAWYVGSLRGVGNLTLALVLAVGGLRVAGGALGAGRAHRVPALPAPVLRPARRVGPVLQRLPVGRRGAGEDRHGARHAAGRPRARRADLAAVAPVRGELRFAGVRFAYRSDQRRSVLPELSLTVPAGQTVALVGATGAGKSTLAKLAARFYEPTDGAVTLDGVDLRDIADAELRSALVMITQEAFLFSGSVADNIALGRPDAPRAAIVAAAEAVGARPFVEALPDGFDTDVRKRGGRLSAGQRQLVGLARVVLADPAVVLLDEATSSLDVPSERAVQAALETVLADRTALIIAHRLSTVLIADRVLVMADGRVVEDGSPTELLADGGPFAELHAAWRASLHHP